MFQNLEIFKTAAAMARHAATRQAITATNLANADTPGYRAQALPSFVDSYSESTSPVSLRATRSQHQNGPTATRNEQANGYGGAEASPNGNSVSLELEMIQAVEIQREHQRALTIYKHSLDVLRKSLGRN